MKNKKFDQELKSELEKYQSSADPNSIWAAIESEVALVNEASEKEDRKPLIWIFSFLLVGVLAGTIMLKPWNFVGAETSVMPLANTELNAQIPKPVTKNIEISFISEKPETEVNTTTETLPSIQKKVAISIFNNKKSPSKLTNLETQFTASSNPAAIPAKKMKVTSLDNAFYFKQAIKETVDVLTFSNSEKETSSTLSIKEEDISNNAGTMLSPLSNQLIQIQIPYSGISKMLSPPLLPVPSFADRRRRRTPAWSVGLEIQGGAALTNRNLSLKNIENQTWLDLREATESTLETVQIGGLIDLQHRSGFAISTGIQWSRIAEKYTIEEITTTQNLENALISYSIDMNQDTVNRTYDDILRTSTTTTAREGFNNYRLLDIPLLIGYHIKNETWSLGFQTGILTNLSLSTKGYIYDENNLLVDINANQKNIYKSSIGIGFYVGLTGRVALNDNLQITASPFYQKNAGSFTLSEGPITQKYSWLGLNIGLRYGF